MRLLFHLDRDFRSHNEIHRTKANRTKANRTKVALHSFGTQEALQALD